MKGIRKEKSGNYNIGIIQMAILYLTRLKKKSRLLFFIMFLLLFLFLGGIAVYTGIQNNIKQIYQGMEGYFSVTSVDPAYRIDDSFIEQIMEDKNIVRYNTTLELYLRVPNTTLIPGRFSGTGTTEEYISRFVCNTRSKDHEDFLNENKDLIEGKHIEETNSKVAIISNALATLNHYAIGDTITANIVESSLSLFDNEVIGKTYEFRIIGIYKNNYDQKVDVDTAECNIQDNYIFIDNTTGKEIASHLQGNKRNTYTGGVQFFLDSPQNINQTINELSKEDAFGEREINIMNYRYERSQDQLQTISRFIHIYLCVLGIAGMLVLFGVMQIHLRDRKSEIAIFMSLGVKKAYIILQHIIENIILFFLSWAAASMMTFVLCVVINRFLTGFQFLLTSAGVCLSGMVGLCVILIATLTSHICIVRVSPKQILSKVS